jgi:hypothetical protein
MTPKPNSIIGQLEEIVLLEDDRQVILQIDPAVARAILVCIDIAKRWPSSINAITVLGE